MCQIFEYITYAFRNTRVKSLPYERLKCYNCVLAPRWIYSRLKKQPQQILKTRTHFSLRSKMDRWSQRWPQRDKARPDEIRATNNGGNLPRYWVRSNKQVFPAREPFTQDIIYRIVLWIEE